MLRRMTHIDHFPSGGEIAHVQGHVLRCEGGYWVICAQELGQFVWEVAVDRASALGGGPIGVDALPAGAGHEGHLPPQGDPQAAQAAEEALRRRHRRRRLARSRDGVLPRDPPRDHERRDPREELHRLGSRRSQHDDHPSELPHAGRRRVLQGERQALREALGRPRLQHDVLAARPLHAGSLRPFARGTERACRGEQAARDRQSRDRPSTR